MVLLQHTPSPFKLPLLAIGSSASIVLGSFGISSALVSTSTASERNDGIRRHRPPARKRFSDQV